MQFSRVGKHTIRCVITEDEISDLGFSVDEIVTNGARTQEFMNQIFDLAEQEFETKFDLGVKTVQVEFRSDHTLSLTFSEHPSAEGMMEHLRDIINGILGSIPQEKWEELAQKQNASQGAEHEEEDVCILLGFDHITDAVRFAGRLGDSAAERIPSELYRSREKLYLILHLLHCSEEQVRRLSVITDEYVGDIEVGKQRYAYMREHGTALLKENALAHLARIS